MARELGDLEQAVVLPPIPAEHKEVAGVPKGSGRIKPRKPFRIIYAGTLQGPYGRMIRELSFSLLNDGNAGWALEAYGTANDWPASEMEELRMAGIYQGIVGQGEELESTLQGADALLVVMNFESAYRRRVRTSFPSKILDYLAHQKPIIAWGPDECFAVEFNRRYRLGAEITKKCSVEVVKCLASIYPNELRTQDF